jgi:ATP-binding cassette subfamily B protein
MSGRAYTDLGLYRRLLREARPYWLHLVGIFLLSLLATPLALLLPLPMTVVVDCVIGSRPLPNFLNVLLPASARSSSAVLGLMVAGLVALAVLSQLLDVGVSLLRASTGERLVLGFRSRLFAHVQRLSLSYHDSRGTAESVYRIQYDAQSIQNIVIEGVVPFVSAFFTLASMLWVAVRIDAQLAMVALAITPALLLLLRVYRVKLRGSSREVKRLEASALSVVQEVLSAIRVVKAFGQEEREQGRFVDHSSEGMRARIRLAIVEASFGLAVAATTAIGTAAVLLIGARHVHAGVITLGQLLLVMAYLARLYEPLKTISKKSASLQSHLASAERAFALLDRAPDVEELPGAMRIARAQGAVAFRDVSFSYDGTHPVLRDISFDVRTGTRVAVSGATGAGKTTLVSLLTRAYDPTAGGIFLDGIDLRQYRLADLRNQFAVVLQEPVLFSTTIGENIAYGRLGASQREVVAAAEAAGAHEFILGLPQGYETQVGERGMRLSGGERQRIALARAFLKDAPIVILDEPTSSVDAATEAGILEAIERLLHGRTAFLIAHRETTLVGCGAVIFLEHGRLVDARVEL